MKTYREFLLEQTQSDILNEMGRLDTLLDKTDKFEVHIFKPGNREHKEGPHIHIKRKGEDNKSSGIRFFINSGEIDDKWKDENPSGWNKKELKILKKETEKYIDKNRDSLDNCWNELKDKEHGGEGLEFSEVKDRYKTKFKGKSKKDIDDIKKGEKNNKKDEDDNKEENNKTNKNSGSGDDTYDPVKRRQYYEETGK